MKIIVVGAGNVGLATALCFAKNGHLVYCVDNDHSKIKKLQQGQITLYEPKLQELLSEQIQNKNIFFTESLDSVLKQTSVIFLTVGTPNLNTGQADIRAIESVVDQISRYSDLPTLFQIIIRSTAPPETNKYLSKKYPSLHFITSPEFLREGSALSDGLNPDRIIIGTDSNPEADLALFKEIYKNFKLNPEKYFLMNSVSAEMTKYAANIFLAARVSLINEFSRVCEKNGADIHMIKNGLGADKRIGSEFLNAGLGYGGSCFPKDIEAYLHYSLNLNEDLKITKSVKETNALQIYKFTEKIISCLKNNFYKKVCLWGASFKPETDDLRGSPSLKIISALIENGFTVNIFDPEAHNSLKALFNNRKEIFIYTDKYEALAQTEALIIATEWSEFISCDLSQVKHAMLQPNVFDGRNIFDPENMKSLGFNYVGVGRPT